jgi:TolB-like protein
MSPSARTLLVLCVGAAAPLWLVVPQTPPTVAVLPFTAVGDTTDAAAAESFSRNVAASLARGRGVEVRPWALVRQTQLASGGDPRRIAEASGARYVVNGALLRRGMLVRLIVEVVDGRDGRTLLAVSYDLAAESLVGMADSVASVVASQVMPVRLTPTTTWKPPALLWVYLLLLAATIVLAARKRTSWLSLVGVGLLPPYFLWVLWDAWRSPADGGTKEASTQDIDAKVDVLIFKFKDPDRTQHEASVRKMIALGAPAVERLLQYLRHDDEWARVMAAAALGKMNDARAIEPLRRALNDSDQGVRHMAGLALNALSGGGTAPPVVEELRSLRNSIFALSQRRSDAVPAVGPGAGQAVENIQIVCRNVDEAVRALETGLDPHGRRITKTQVAAGLRRLVDATRQPACISLLTVVLGDDAIRSLENHLRELERMADTIVGTASPL